MFSVHALARWQTERAGEQGEVGCARGGPETRRTGPDWPILCRGDGGGVSEGEADGWIWGQQPTMGETLRFWPS